MVPSCKELYNDEENWITDEQELLGILNEECGWSSDISNLHQITRTFRWKPRMNKNMVSSLLHPTTVITWMYSAKLIPDVLAWGPLYWSPCGGPTCPDATQWHLGAWSVSAAVTLDSLRECSSAQNTDSSVSVINKNHGPTEHQNIDCKVEEWSTGNDQLLCHLNAAEKNLPFLAAQTSP